MKNRFVVAVALLLIAVVAVAAFAVSTAKPPAAKPGTGVGRPGPGGPGGPGRPGGFGGFNRWMDDLGLSAAQKTKIEAIQKSAGTQMRAIFENKKLTDDQKRTKMMAINQDTMKKVNAVLTPAQRTKLQKMRPPMGGPGGRQFGGPGRFYDQLGLSATQKTKIEAIQKDAGTKYRALFDNKKLTDDQRRSKMMAIRADTDKKISAILTPAQRTKLQKMREQRPPRLNGN